MLKTWSCGVLIMMCQVWEFCRSGQPHPGRTLCCTLGTDYCTKRKGKRLCIGPSNTTANNFMQSNPTNVLLTPNRVPNSTDSRNICDGLQILGWRAHLVNLNQSPSVGLQGLDRLAILPNDATHLQGIVQGTGAIRQPQLQLYSKPCPPQTTMI
jgi:hypothetical protein